MHYFFPVGGSINLLSDVFSRQVFSWYTKLFQFHHLVQDQRDERGDDHRDGAVTDDSRQLIAQAFASTYGKNYTLGWFIVDVAGIAH